MNQSNGRFLSARWFWCLGFAYSAFMALLLQKVFLPLNPSMHAGFGLMHNDAIVFHNLAVELAQKVEMHGWSAWTLFPSAGGNVGILAAIYKIFGPDPAYFIPLNAAAHALGATLIYRLGRTLVRGRVGALGGMIAGVVFLAFPSALQWYGQNHKDAFAIAGTLLLLDVWVNVHAAAWNSRIVWRYLGCAVLGVVLVGIVRPYFAILVSIALLGSWCVSIGVRLTIKDRPRLREMLGPLLMILIVFLASLVFIKQKSTFDVYEIGNVDRFAKNNWAWRYTDTLPKPFDDALRRASELRNHFVSFGRAVSAKSEIDGDNLPDNAWDALRYMPRALVVGLFAPFPDTWTERFSIPRLVGAVETSIWYVFFLGFAITLWRLRSKKLLLVIPFCSILLVMLAYTHPNVGTLYRHRFGLWQVFLLCGALGWAWMLTIALNRQRSRTQRSSSRIDSNGHTSNLRGMDRVFASGAVVIVITLMCYLGFLARDLMLVKLVGLGGALDAFFTAAMMVMFFVSFLVMPVTDALTNALVALQQTGDVTQRDSLVRQTLAFFLAVTIAATSAAMIGAPQVLKIFFSELGSVGLREAGTVLWWFSPIIVMSAWTIVGNATLNALGGSKEAAWGQLAVPAIVLIALMSSTPEAAAWNCIVGMLLGTGVNIILVIYFLHRKGIRFLPERPSWHKLSPVLSIYWPLVFSALLTAALVPLNYAFASGVTQGAISAWAMASKIVVLFTGLMSVGASAVILPHLTHIASRSTIGDMRSDSFFLMIVGCWLGGMIAIVALLFAEPMVALTIGGNLTDDQVAELSTVIKVGVMQLPIILAGGIIAKMALVSDYASRIFLAAALAFASNLVTNILLVNNLGVLGVAVGALVATVISTTALTLLVHRKINLSLQELICLAGSWFIWGGVGVAVQSGIAAAMVCAALCLVGMAWVCAKTVTLRQDILRQ